MVTALAQRAEPQASKRITEHMPLSEQELVVFCPGCKTLEVLWFSKGGLMPTRKFNQADDQVYHDCGFGEPCRLFRHS